MKRSIRILIAVAIFSSVAIVSPAFAQHDHSEGAGHSHSGAEGHGGTVTMTKEFHFETVFHHNGVMVYVYDGKQAPLDARDLTGTVAIQFRDRNKEALQANLEYVAGEGGAVGHLHGSLDMEGLSDQKAKAQVDIHGLGGSAEKDVSYRETVKLSEEAEGDHGHDEKKGHDDDGHGHDHGHGTH